MAGAKTAESKQLRQIVPSRLVLATSKSRLVLEAPCLNSTSGNRLTIPLSVTASTLYY